MSSDGDQANGGDPFISANGRFVAFDSGSGRLVDGDTNGESDAFVRDRRTGTTTRVSVSSSGHQANGRSSTSAISPNGRFVAFWSLASNLGSRPDTNDSFDAFVRDRWTGRTRMVSVSSTEAGGDSASAYPSISANGRFAAFDSSATNLVPGDTNRQPDVFVRDLWAGTTRRVSVSSAGAQGSGASQFATISADGRFVAFDSGAPDLVRGDDNDHRDVFVRDLRAHTTRLVSVSSAGSQGNGRSVGAVISSRGRFVVFRSSARNLAPDDTNHRPDILIRDRRAHTTTLVSVSSSGGPANGASYDATISEGGRFVAFDSTASNLVAGDTNHIEDVFVRDRESGTTVRVSVSSTGDQAEGGDFSEYGSISGDGRFVAFESYCQNLVPGDTNHYVDVFLRGPIH